MAVSEKEKADAEEITPSSPGEAVVEIPMSQYHALREDAQKAKEHWEQLLRIQAEFDNARKRMAREKTEAILFANEKFLEKLLPVLDNFEAGLASLSSAKDVAAIETGIRMIYSQFQNLFKEFGVEEIPTEGQKFNPNIHEAVKVIETKDHPEGTVTQQLRKGYRYKERLLRPSMVVIAQSPAGDEPSSGTAKSASAES